MLASKYKGFLEALEDSEALEKRFIELGKSERTAFWTALFMDLVSIFTLAVGVFGYMKTGQVGAMAFVAPIMFSVAVIQLVIIKSIQSEIRSLLLFKKLREEGLAR